MTVSVHLPSSEEGKRFCAFFDHRFSFITAPIPDSGKPEWKTVNAYPIEHRNLWNRFLDEDVLVGLSFGSVTHYLMADIDRGSPYHPHNNETLFKDLVGAFEDIGFNAHIVVQSSWSEGIHVYFPLLTEVPTYKLAVLARQVAIRSGFRVKDGTLEFFPNTKAYNKDRPTAYKAHRLPLQSGSFLLDDDYQPYSSSIKVFLDRAQDCALAQDVDVIETALEAAYHTKSFRFIKGDSGSASAFASDLREQIEEGWSDFGQTNDLLRVIGTYGRVFVGLGGQELSDYIAATAKGLPGYAKFCRHQHQIERRARDWARCIEKFYYPYGEEPSRRGTFAEMRKKAPKENKVNDERQQSAIDRIKAGVEYVKEELVQLPKRVGDMKEALVRAIVELFGVRPSDNTLYRYKDLWHPRVVGDKENEYVDDEAEEKGSCEDVSVNSVISDVLVVEPLLEADCSLCHTPCVDVVENGCCDESLDRMPCAVCRKIVTPPSHMKVLYWICERIGVILPALEVIDLEISSGEKRSKHHSLCQSELDIICDQNFLTKQLYPSQDDKENLRVSRNSIESACDWLIGVVVLAKHFQFVLDG